MPQPSKGETKDQFIKRCMSETVSEGKDQSQAYAICESKWENRKYNKLKKFIKKK